MEATCGQLWLQMFGEPFQQYSTTVRSQCMRGLGQWCHSNGADALAVAPAAHEPAAAGALPPSWKRRTGFACPPCATSHQLDPPILHQQDPRLAFASQPATPPAALSPGSAAACCRGSQEAHFAMELVERLSSSLAPKGLDVVQPLALSW